MSFLYKRLKNDLAPPSSPKGWDGGMQTMVILHVRWRRSSRQAVPVTCTLVYLRVILVNFFLCLFFGTQHRPNRPKESWMSISLIKLSRFLMFRVPLKLISIYSWLEPLLYKREGLSFWNFWKRKGGSDFSHKKGGVEKTEAGGCFKKGGITYFHTN